MGINFILVLTAPMPDDTMHSASGGRAGLVPFRLSERPFAICAIHSIVDSRWIRCPDSSDISSRKVILIERRYGSPLTPRRASTLISFYSKLDEDVVRGPPSSEYETVEILSILVLERSKKNRIRHKQKAHSALDRHVVGD